MATIEEKRRIFIVIAVLAVLLIGIVFIRSRNKWSLISDSDNQAAMEEEATGENENAVMEEPGPENTVYLTVEESSYGQDAPIPVKVQFAAPGRKIFGSDLIILYDPEYLSAGPESITDGDFFESIPRKSVDQENGVIKITAYNGKDVILTDLLQEILTVNFIPLRLGTTTVSVSFSEDLTNSSNLVEVGTSENILDMTESATINVQGGT